MSGALSVQHREEGCSCGGSSENKQRQQLPDFAQEDADLAMEMNKLSVEEREKVFEDVHGVSTVQEETPELIKRSIEALDAATIDIPSKDRKAYNKALFFKPSLQKDQKFKLQFLRAEEFNPRKAAQRMIKYFDLMLDLFGEEKLANRLTFDDLTDAEQNIFRIGYMTMLPRRDRSGRPIIFGDGTKLDFELMTIDNIVRCLLYMMVSCFAEDEIAQRKGVCVVLRFSGQCRSVSEATELARRSAYTSHCYPGKIASFHICYDDPQMQFIISTLLWAGTGFTRVRTRTHYGSEIDNEYKLLTFGIPSQGLFQKATGGERTMFDEYIQNRREADETAEAKRTEMEARTGIISHPQPKDVLIGRGRSFRDLPCNAVWAKAIQDRFELHRNSSAFEKNCISMVIVKTVNSSGSRFLERTDDGWKEVSEDAARDKTAIAFRNKARSLAIAARGTKHPAPTACCSCGEQTPNCQPMTKRQRLDPNLQHNQRNSSIHYQTLQQPQQKCWIVRQLVKSDF